MSIRTIYITISRIDENLCVALTFSVVPFVFVVFPRFINTRFNLSGKQLLPPLFPKNLALQSVLEVPLYISTQPVIYANLPLF